MPRTDNVIEWALVLRQLQRFNDEGHDPTTDEVAERMDFGGSKFADARKTYTWLSRLVREHLAIRVPRKNESVMRWQLTAVGKDTCDRLRDTFSLFDDEASVHESGADDGGSVSASRTSAEPEGSPQ